jgi:hypothetical protein
MLFGFVRNEELGIANSSFFGFFAGTDLLPLKLGNKVLESEKFFGD